MAIGLFITWARGRKLRGQGHLQHLETALAGEGVGQAARQDAAIAGFEPVIAERLAPQAERAFEDEEHQELAGMALGCPHGRSTRR